MEEIRTNYEKVLDFFWIFPTRFNFFRMKQQNIPFFHLDTQESFGFSKTIAHLVNSFDIFLILREKAKFPAQR